MNNFDTSYRQDKEGLKLLFEPWLIKNIPYKDQLTSEEYEDLFFKWYDWYKWDKIADNTFLTALSSRSGVDFTNDWQKAISKCSSYNRELQDTIRILDQKFIDNNISR